MERDTVRPDEAKVNLSISGTIGNEAIGININGEGLSMAKVVLIGNDGTKKELYYGLNTKGNFTKSDIYYATCGFITYFVEVELIDRAENISAKVKSNSVTSGECRFCSSEGRGYANLPFAPNTKYYVTGEYLENRGGNYHAGIDFALPKDTPVVTASPGIIKKIVYGHFDNYPKSKEQLASGNLGWANYILVEHYSVIGGEDDIPEISYAVYAHLSPQRVQSLQVGQYLNPGEVIGYIGSTGASTGYHLHFQTEAETTPYEAKVANKRAVTNPFNPRSILPEIEGKGGEGWEAENCEGVGEGGYGQSVFSTEYVPMDLDEKYLNYEKLQDSVTNILNADATKIDESLGRDWLDKFTTGFADAITESASLTPSKLRELNKKINEIKEYSLLDYAAAFARFVMEIIEFINNLIDLIRNPENIIKNISEWLLIIENRIAANAERDDPDKDPNEDTIDRGYMIGWMMGELAYQFAFDAILGFTITSILTVANVLFKVARGTLVTTFNIGKVIDNRWNVYRKPRALLGRSQIDGELGWYQEANSFGNLGRQDPGVRNRDAAVIVEKVDDVEYDDFRRRIKDDKFRNEADDYRNGLKACGLIGLTKTAQASPTTLELAKAVLTGSVQVNAQAKVCPVPPDIAKLIKAAGGNPLKTLEGAYTTKNGKVIWLEEGFTKPYDDAFGFVHILERHYPGVPSLNGKGTLYPSVPHDEIINNIFDTIKKSETLVSGDVLIFENIVKFSDGTSGPHRVLINKNGSIISAYLTKTAK